MTSPLPPDAYPTPALGVAAVQSIPVEDAPYAADEKSSLSPEGGAEEIHARPAPLWRRAMATLIDGAILGSVVAGYLWIAAAIVGTPAEAADASGLEALMQGIKSASAVLVPGAFLAVVIAAAYSAVFALLWGGRTPGRAVLGLRLVDASGAPPGPVRAVIRAILSVVSFAALLAGFWLALFDRRGQTLHDKLTSTFVVRMT